MLPIFGFIIGALLQVIGAIWYFDAVKLNGEESTKPAPEPTQLPEPTPEILKSADGPKIEIPTEPNKPDEIAL